jgi:hypothetical protein
MPCEQKFGFQQSIPPSRIMAYAQTQLAGPNSGAVSDIFNWLCPLYKPFYDIFFYFIFFGLLGFTFFLIQLGKLGMPLRQNH